MRQSSKDGAVSLTRRGHPRRHLPPPDVANPSRAQAFLSSIRLVAEPSHIVHSRASKAGTASSSHAGLSCCASSCQIELDDEHNDGSAASARCLLLDGGAPSAATSVRYSPALTNAQLSAETMAVSNRSSLSKLAPVELDEGEAAARDGALAVAFLSSITLCSPTPMGLAPPSVSPMSCITSERRQNIDGPFAIEGASSDAMRVAASVCSIGAAGRELEAASFGRVASLDAHGTCPAAVHIAAEVAASPDASADKCKEGAPAAEDGTKQLCASPSCSRNCSPNGARRSSSLPSMLRPRAIGSEGSALSGRSASLRVLDITRVRAIGAATRALPPGNAGVVQERGASSGVAVSGTGSSYLAGAAAGGGGLDGHTLSLIHI